MTEDKIKNLLQKADKTAGTPAPISANLTADVRRRANQRRFARLAAPVAAAVTVLIAFGIWRLTGTPPDQMHEQSKVAALQAEIKQLQAQTDATLKLVREVLENQRRQHRIAKLEAKLASIPNPLEETQRQADKTAFTLVYEANRMYGELNQRDSAIQTYKRVIELFPRSKWADVARRRLSEIHNSPVNKNGLSI
jgi:tetratricopeptide (TPR) repeat protein